MVKVRKLFFITAIEFLVCAGLFIVWKLKKYSHELNEITRMKFVFPYFLNLAVMTLKLNIFIICAVAVVWSCNSKTDSVIHATSDSLKYAVGFSVTQLGNSKLVTVNYPYQGAQDGYQYLLVPKGEEIPDHTPSVQVIQIPIDNIVCTSTTHIPLLDYIDETNSLIGFPTTDYISSEKMRSRIDAGEVTDLGIDKGMDIEVLYSLHPDLVMGYTMSKDLGQLKKIQELGIPVVINAEYLEKHPLGRAEWIKFMALFFDKQKEADSVFNEIERAYRATQALVREIEIQPTILSGVVYGDTWFMPAGQNYAAKLFEDAGLNYLWKETDSNGFLELSFESVYAKAKDVDLWIGVGSFTSLTEMKLAEARYSLFSSFTNSRVYTYNARKGAKGGSEFLELGYLRPDLILKDLVKIGHPDKLPDYELFFHERLK
jgi:iron complex transport system substrate-binding protein